MIQLLRVMQRGCLYYYILLTHFYIIITSLQRVLLLFIITYFSLPNLQMLNQTPFEKCSRENVENTKEFTSDSV